jgi:hypothetical protein
MNIGIIPCSRPVWLMNSSCCSSGWRAKVQFFHWDWEVVRWEAFQAPSQTPNSNTANSNTAPRGSASTPVPPITNKDLQASLFLALAVRMGPVQYPRWVLQKWPKSAKSKLVSVNLSLCYWTGIARIPVSVGWSHILSLWHPNFPREAWECRAFYSLFMFTLLSLGTTSGFQSYFCSMSGPVVILVVQFYPLICYIL